RFRSILQPVLVRFDDAKEALLLNLNAKVEDLFHRLDLANTALETASPLKILERGYSVVTFADAGKKNGVVVRRSRDVRKGDSLKIRLMEGEINAEAGE
ncbi:MAG: exodeoxyribonuclease VII large subunit, partial [Treponema sp.]|nr:exodeoxyribonuclease VII large subunit [Treponema sp.]